MPSSVPPPQDDLGPQSEERPFPTTAESLRFGLSTLRGAPIPLLALATLREAIPRLISYATDRGLPPLTALLAWLFGLALVITLSYRIVFAFYDRHGDEPTPFRGAPLVTATFRNCSSLVVLILGWLAITLVFAIAPPGLAGVPVYFIGAVAVFIGIVFLTKFGFAFAAAVEWKGDTKQRSLGVTNGPHARVALATNVWLLALAVALLLGETAVANLLGARSTGSWIWSAASIAATFLTLGMVVGATVSMYRAVYPAGADAPTTHRASTGDAPQDKLD